MVKNKRGFTLTELLITMIVVASMSVGVTLYMSGALDDADKAAEKERIGTDITRNESIADACGDGICNGITEIGGPNGICLIDCACGNSKCDPGESPTSCKEDCCGYCGDGKCMGYACQEDNESSKSYCPKQNGGDCGNVCGDGVCDKGESVCLCAIDCKWQKCGDGECTSGDGGPEQCPQDCAAKCGDCICAGGEDYIKCPNDCGYCGDNVCSNCTQLKENPRECLLDCPLPEVAD